VNRTLILRKAGSQFIETVATEGKHAATRSYDCWEKVEARLLRLGLLPEEIANLKTRFDLGEVEVRMIELSGK
jgi:hypothetical protein